MDKPSAHHTPASTPRPTPNHAKPALQCSGRQYNLGDALPRNESMPLEHIAGLQVWKLRMLRLVIVKISGRDLPSGIERPKSQCAEEIYLFTDFLHGPLELQASPRPCPAFTPFARARAPAGARCCQFPQRGDTSVSIEFAAPRRCRMPRRNINCLLPQSSCQMLPVCLG